MSKGLYSHFEWISYIICGLVILIAADIAFGDFGAHLIAHSRLLGVEGMKTIFVVAIAYMVGHANSHLAHWVLQEFTTATTLGRPSRWLLFGKSLHRIKYFRRMNARDLNAVFRRLREEGWDDTIDHHDDRRIFGIAFSHAQKGEDFREAHFRLLNAFNFSRNMTTALTFVLVFFLYRLFAGCPHATQKCAALASEMQIGLWVLIATAILVALRYLHFLHTYSSHVLREYGRSSPQHSGAVDVEECLNGQRTFDSGHY